MQLATQYNSCLVTPWHHEAQTEQACNMSVQEPNAVDDVVIVEEACPAGLHHSGFSCGNHQPKIFFEIPDVSAACCCLHQW